MTTKYSKFKNTKTWLWSHVSKLIPIALNIPHLICRSAVDSVSDILVVTVLQT